LTVKELAKQLADVSHVQCDRTATAANQRDKKLTL